jgi:3-hydroxybutyryl-CoA dehydrogenase
MDIKTIAVVGAGTQGRAIALLALRAGYRTVLEDFSVTTIENAVAMIRRELNEDFSRSNLATYNRVEDAIRDTDLIIETAADEMETKLELFTIFDKFSKPNAILATTSASLQISEIAEITSCAERCIALWFDPIEAPTRMDVVSGKHTSADTVAVCMDVGQRLVKAVSIVR